MTDRRRIEPDLDVKGLRRLAGPPRSRRARTAQALAPLADDLKPWLPPPPRLCPSRPPRRRAPLRCPGRPPAPLADDLKPGLAATPILCLTGRRGCWAAISGWAAVAASAGLAHGVSALVRRQRPGPKALNNRVVAGDEPSSSSFPSTHTSS